MHYLLSIDDTSALGILIGAILGTITWYYMLRASVRADKIVKNQEAMIWFMILQCKKNGASDEEIQKIKDFYGIK